MPSPSSNRAIGYFRVSTVRQSSERHVSLETQAERFASYCQQNALVAVKTFTDTDTGRKDNRKEYQAMLRFLEDKTADLVIVQYLDRFGRNPKEILRRIWALQEVGVTVCATDEDIKEELILLVRAGLAGAESKKNSMRVKSNMGRVVSRGTHIGRVPFGFDGIRKIHPDGKARISEFALNDSEAALIRFMYNLAVNLNLGFKIIADRLNDLGHKTKNGNIFDACTVRLILKNKAIMGTLVYGARPRNGDRPELIVIEKFFPPVLSVEQWDKMQNVFDIRRNKHLHGRSFTSGYLLSGIAQCGYCGGTLTGRTNLKQGYSNRYYQCGRATHAKAKCEYHNNHNADKLENAVLEKLSEYADRRRTLQILKNLSEEPREKNINQINRDVKACEREFAIHLNLLKKGSISEKQFALANEPVKQRYDILLARQQDLGKDKSNRIKLDSWHKELADSLSTFIEDFNRLDFPQRKAKLLDVIKEIRVFKDRPIEIYLRDRLSV